MDKSSAEVVAHVAAELHIPSGKIDYLPDTELRALAKEMVEGTVFSDRHLRAPEDFGMVFMVVLLGGFRHEVEYSRDHPKDPESVGLFYEYVSEASPRGVNGYPCFMSARVINKADTKKLMGFCEEYQKATKDFAHVEVA